LRLSTAEIEKSWLRCVASGVNPESLAPRYSLPQRSESQLLRASGKVIQQCVQELADTSTSRLLADRNGLVLEIWSGDKDLARKLDRSHSAPGYIMYGRG
jgi:transcriptional regulator of acetoin/glycerol metabolism